MESGFSSHREKRGHEEPGDAVDTVAAPVSRHDEGFERRRGHEFPEADNERIFRVGIQHEEAERVPCAGSKHIGVMR